MDKKLNINGTKMCSWANFSWRKINNFSDKGLSDKVCESEFNKDLFHPPIQLCCAHHIMSIHLRTTPNRNLGSLSQIPQNLLVSFTSPFEQSFDHMLHVFMSASRRTGYAPEKSQRQKSIFLTKQYDMHFILFIFPIQSLLMRAANCHFE